jgi:hypothetical protein
MPVKYTNINKEEKMRLPYLEFVRMDIQDSTAAVEFKYPVEGVAGTVAYR